MSFLQDPRQGNSAKVSDNGRLAVKSTESSDHAVAAVAGESWNLSMTQLTVTVDTQVAVWYFKNTGTETIIFDDIYINLNATTGGSGPGTITVTKQPDGGTVISDASSTGFTEVNRNMGSAKTSGATYYLASASGKTLTGGTDIFQAERNAGGQSIFSWNGTIVCPPGTAIGVLYQAPSGNTSQAIRINATYFAPQDEQV